jgi:hypothetical protein
MAKKITRNHEDQRRGTDPRLLARRSLNKHNRQEFTRCLDDPLHIDCFVQHRQNLRTEAQDYIFGMNNISTKLLVSFQDQGN